MIIKLKYRKLCHRQDRIEKLLVFKDFSSRHGKESKNIRNVVQTHGFVVALWCVQSITLIQTFAFQSATLEPLVFVISIQHRKEIISFVSDRAFILFTIQVHVHG